MEYLIDIKPDKDGYIGRECPECEKYFKIKLGTGMPDTDNCHCPYCNCVDKQDEFWTKQQIEYAESVVFNKVSTDLLGTLKKIEIKPRRNDFISIGITVKGSPEPIIYYSEKELEEKIICANCDLDYTIFGIFGYCPDCGINNSYQIFKKNINVILKMIDKLSANDLDIQNKVIENALEDIVSTFDAFGRELYTKINQKISFQDISKACEKVKKDLNIDISEDFEPDQWNFITQQFQKRHLISHKMGIVDEEYIKKTNENPNQIGHKIIIKKDDVVLFSKHTRILAKKLYKSIIRN